MSEPVAKNASTERVSADRLRSDDWLVMFRWPAGAKAEERRAWKLRRVVPSNGRVWVQAEGGQSFRVAAGTMFLRLKRDRSINMRPDLAGARA